MTKDELKKALKDVDNFEERCNKLMLDAKPAKYKWRTKNENNKKKSMGSSVSKD
jgi:hypothetical protein